VGYLSLNYYDSMEDGDNRYNQYTTRPNEIIVSHVRPAINLDQLAEQISALEAIPLVIAIPKARSLYWTVRGRLDDPWLAARLTRLTGYSAK